MASTDIQSTFMLGLTAGCAYFSFKLYRIWQEPELYSTIVNSLTVFSVLGLLCLLLCAASGILVWTHFGRGLKESCELPSL
jgi:hypothetical protein